jgi:hypothetical protein
VGKPAFAAGYFGKGIVLDGSNYVAIPSSPGLEARNASITVSTWFRVDSWSGRWETGASDLPYGAYAIVSQMATKHGIAIAPFGWPSRRSAGRLALQGAAELVKRLRTDRAPAATSRNDGN